MLLPAGFGLPEAGYPVIISDTTAASSNFAVYHLIQLAQERGIPATVVDFRQEGVQSHQTILRKLGSKPPSFLSPSPLPDSPLPLFTSSGEPTLLPTFNALPKSGLVILDGLSELESIGFTPMDIVRFVRAARDTGVLLAVTLHAELPGSGDKAEAPELLQRLLRIGGSWWRIQGLASGRSADVTGEISRHSLNAKGEDIGRANPLQYRLELGGVKTFAKGTGRGYL